MYQIDGPDNADPSSVIAQITGQSVPDAPAPQTPVDNSTGARVQTGLNRATAGVADVLGMGPDFIENTWQNLKDMFHQPTRAELEQEAKTGQLVSAPSRDRSQDVGTSAWLKAFFQRHGIGTDTVDPRDPVQRYIGAASEMAPTGLLGAESGPGALVQAGSAGLAGAAQEATGEAGLTPVAQQLTALTAGALPGAAAGAVMGAPRYALGVTNKGAPERQQALQDAANAGINNPTVGQVTGLRVPQALESLFAKIPGAAGVIVKTIGSQAQAAANRIHEIAQQLSPRASARAAGLAVDKGITGSFMERTQATRKQLYDTLDSLIPGDTEVDITPYQGALDDLTKPIPGAAAQTALIRKSTNGDFIDSLKGSLAHDQKQAAIPKGSQPFTMPARDGWTDQQGNYIPAKSPQGQLFAGLNPKVLEQNGYARVQSDETPGFIVPGANGPQFLAEKDIVPSTTTTYNTIKQLRSTIGQKMDTDALTLTKRDANLSRVYASLSDIMRQAAEDAGPQAQNAYSRASTYYKAVLDRQETLQKIIDANGGPEGIYAAALRGAKNGPTIIHKVMQSLPPDAQRTVTATVLDRLGRANPGAQNAEGSEWSFSTFLTNYNKLSPEAQQELFGRIDEGYRTALDSMARFSARQRKGAEVFKNPSGTAGATAEIAVGDEMARAGAHAVSGNFAPAIKLISALLGANIGARMMANPTFVKWLAKTYQYPVSASPMLIATLGQQAKAQHDPNLVVIAEKLRQGLAALKPQGAQ